MDVKGIDKEMGTWVRGHLGVLPIVSVLSLLAASGTKNAVCRVTLKCNGTREYNSCANQQQGPACITSQLQGMGPKRFVLSADNDNLNEFRSRCE